MKKVASWLDAVATVTGNLIAPLALVMTLFTCAVVTARYLFQTGAVPLQETVIYLHGMVFMLGISYTPKEGAHVRVDILYQRFSPRGRAIVNLLGHWFFLLPFCAFVFWSSLDYVALSLSMREGSAEPGGLPGVYLLKMLIPAMAVLLSLQAMSEILKCLTTLSGRNV